MRRPIPRLNYITVLIIKVIFSILVIDASSKLQSGILYGNLYNLGEYDECVDANHMTEDGLLQGKYCMISVGVNASAFPTDPQMQKEQMLKKMTRQLVTQTRYIKKILENSALILASTYSVY